MNCVILLLGLCLLQMCDASWKTNPFTWTRDVRRQSNQDFIYGHCELQLNSGGENSPNKDIWGSIGFRQPLRIFSRGTMDVRVRIGGLPTDDRYQQYSLHVHEYGDLSDGCANVGRQYNPFGHYQWVRTQGKRHIGDFGTFTEGPDGAITKTVKDKYTTIVGQHSIIGRSLVLYAGISGPHIACCVIGKARKLPWRQQ